MKRRDELARIASQKWGTDSKYAKYANTEIEVTDEMSKFLSEKMLRMPPKLYHIDELNMMIKDEEILISGLDIYILNERSKGRTYKSIGDTLELSYSQVSGRLRTTIKIFKHPKVGRKLFRE